MHRRFYPDPTIAIARYYTQAMVHAPANSLSPAAERIEFLDVLRGFTLAGILLANILWFNGFFELAPKYRQAMLQSSADEWVVICTRLFVHAKFYTIFAFLFGLGFASLLNKYAGADTPVLQRRLCVLFAIGLVHSLIWWGDIVRYYALIGFTLFYFQKRTNQHLLLWIGVLSVLPLVIEALRAVLLPGYENYSFLRVRPRRWLGYIQNASFFELFLTNIKMMGDHLIKNLWNGRFFKILSLFLLGLLTARLKLFEQPQRYAHLVWPTLLISGVIGLSGNAFITSIYYQNYAFEVNARDVVKESVELIAVPALSLAYLCAIWLAAQRFTWLGRLASAGRLSFSNYIAQTLICVIIFKPYFFGYYAKIPLSRCVLIALLIFSTQVLVSALWLRYFHFGPVEWLLRSLTLGRAQTIRRESA